MNFFFLLLLVFICFFQNNEASKTCGSYECDRTTITCNSGSSCTVNCKDFHSCTSATINCPDSNTCKIYCEGDSSCDSLTINGGSHGEVYLYTSGSAVSCCQDITVNAKSSNYFKLDTDITGIIKGNKGSKYYCPTYNPGGTTSVCDFKFEGSEKNADGIYIYAVQGNYDIDVDLEDSQDFSNTYMYCDSSYSHSCAISGTYSSNTKFKCSPTYCQSSYLSPTAKPTKAPTLVPTYIPSQIPTPNPTVFPTVPSKSPSQSPSISPTSAPTECFYKCQCYYICPSNNTTNSTTDGCFSKCSQCSYICGDSASAPTDP